jgi:hypothetical protein
VSPFDKTKKKPPQKMLLLLLLLLLLAAVLAVGGRAKQVLPPDADWRAAYEVGSLLWSPNLASNILVTSCTPAGIVVADPFGFALQIPEIGNGYLSLHPTQGNDQLFLAGVFDGPDSNSPNRAQVPPYTVAANLPTNKGCALDLLHAVFLCRGTASGAVIEQAWYAHQVYRNLVVYSVTVKTGATAVRYPLTASASTFSPNFDFVQVPSPNGTWCMNGSTYDAPRPDVPVVTVGSCATAVPPAISVAAHTIAEFYFLSTFVSTLDSSEPLAQVWPAQEHRE